MALVTRWKDVNLVTNLDLFRVHTTSLERGIDIQIVCVIKPKDILELNVMIVIEVRFIFIFSRTCDIKLGTYKLILNFYHTYYYE